MRELSSLTRDWTRVPCIPWQILNHWTTREVPPVTILNLRETCHLFLPSASPVLAFLYLPCSLCSYRDHPSVFRAWELCTLLPPPPLRSLPRLQPPLSSHRAPNWTSRFLLSPLFQTHIVTCPLERSLCRFHRELILSPNKPSFHTLISVNSVIPDPDFSSKVLGPFLEPSLPAFLSFSHLSGIILSFLSPKCWLSFLHYPFQVPWHSALCCVTPNWSLSFLYSLNSYVLVSTLLFKNIGVAVFLTPLLVCLVAQSRPTLCNPMDCSPPGSAIHGDSPGKYTGVGCHALLQGIFPMQGSNPGLLHCRWILYHLSHQGSPCKRNHLQCPKTEGGTFKDLGKWTNSPSSGSDDSFPV